MSERSDYPAGVPCWVDTLQPDPQRAMRFYGQLFGWEFDGPGPMPADGSYYVARLGGKDVAGVASLPAPGMPAAWNTAVAVDDLAPAVERVAVAGGSVLVEPTDAAPAGRFAVIADPVGAVLSLWEARERRGAQRVNEPSAWAMGSLQTDAPDRAIDFYAQVFGWEAQPLPMGDLPVTLPRRPGYVGGEPQQPVPRDVVAAVLPADGAAGPGAGAAWWGVDFWIADAAAAAARTPGLGGSVHVAPHEVAGFRRTVLADPAGAVFSVSQLLLPHG